MLSVAVNCVKLFNLCANCVQTTSGIFYFYSMLEKPTISIWLDNRRAKTSGKYPVKVRVTHKRQREYYPANIDLTDAEFESVMSAKPLPRLKETRLKLNELERQANEVVDKIVEDLKMEFTIDLFEKYLHIGTADYTDVYKSFQRKIDELKDKEQIKTSEGYTSCMQLLKTLTGRNSLSFAEIDKKFLEKLEATMLKGIKGKNDKLKKMSLTTVGIYTRYIRAIFKSAIDEGFVAAELYPFGRNKYQIPQPANNKRALDQADLVKLLSYQPEEGSWQEYAKALWTFSLHCQGINMKDMASLRYNQLADKKLVFVRQKTKNSTKQNQIPIIVYLSDEALDIIEKWGNKDRSPDNYVFPIYSDQNSTIKNIRIAEQLLKMVNKHMRAIAKTLEIKQDFTFYSARHSFATTLKRQGRSIEEIQEFIGHTDKKTTERYLASFGDDHKRAIMSDFVKQLEKV